MPGSCEGSGQGYHRLSSISGVIRYPPLFFPELSGLPAFQLPSVPAFQVPAAAPYIFPIGSCVNLKSIEFLSSTFVNRPPSFNWSAKSILKSFQSEIRNLKSAIDRPYTRHRIPNAECRVSNPESRLPNTVSLFAYIQNRIPNTEYRASCADRPEPESYFKNYLAYHREPHYDLFFKLNRSCCTIFIKQMFFIKYIQFIFCFEDVVIKIQPPQKRSSSQSRWYPKNI